ncbi:MAG TPA: cytidine deaminase [Thermomonas sp.]|jgi:cytidine deaminase|nr:cytidine deaminase [Thermomonas sp.]HQY49714.1 cytidine deaminase [Thermomonas sp.]HRA56168.1 cytidine deaminase [Thermomonas sp.]
MTARLAATPMHDTAPLQTLAEHAAQQAYAPYSRLRVGAALRSCSSHIYTGCNVENASYTLGCCAERAAIATAVQAEGTHFRLAAIAVAAFSSTGERLPITPCGGCRQALVEFGEEAVVGFLLPDGHWQEVRASDLLPYRFAFPK